MKRYLVVTVFLAVFVSIIAYAGNAEKINELLKNKKAIDMKIHEKRVELIAKDPALKAKHQEIMRLHKELAIQLDKKEEMKKLLDERTGILNKIDEIKNPKYMGTD